MFDNATTDELIQMADQVARKVAQEYPGIEAEDIASEALTRLYESAERLCHANKDHLYKVLEGEGVSYAAKERYDYILFSSQYVYTPREIKAILKHVYYDESARDVPTQRDDWLSADIGPGVVGISIFDVDEAMDRIKPEHRKLLERRYRDGEDIKDRKAVARAIDHLTRAINRRMYRKGYSEEGPGSRKAVSNREARHVTVAEGSFETPRETDALNTLQNERLQERSDPPGTHFNWNKYDN